MFILALQLGKRKDPALQNLVLGKGELRASFDSFIVATEVGTKIMDEWHPLVEIPPTMIQGVRVEVKLGVFPGHLFNPLTVLQLLKDKAPEVYTIVETLVSAED